VGVPLAGIDDQDRKLLGQLHPAVLERPAVEQECAALSAEERSRLVEDPGGNANRAPLCALAGKRELERIGLEVCRGAERERHDHLQRTRRAEPGATRQVRLDDTLDPDRGPAGRAELLRDRGDVPSPAARLTAPVRGASRRRSTAARPSTAPTT